MTDALMSLATAGLFAARWTTRIETEWIRALERKHPDLVGKLSARRDSMRDAIVDWEVPEAAWSEIARGLCMPDPGDVHVLAAALAGGVDCIVTANLRDFPADLLAEYRIEAIDPDRFIITQWDRYPDSAIAAFRQMRARRNRPQSGPEDFVRALERGGLPATADRLRRAVDLI